MALEETVADSALEGKIAQTVFLKTTPHSSRRKRREAGQSKAH